MALKILHTDYPLGHNPCAELFWQAHANPVSKEAASPYQLLGLTIFAETANPDVQEILVE